MERLSERNLHAVMTFLRNAYAQPDLDAFARVVVGDITRAIGAQRVSYNEVHPKRGTIRALIRPADTYPWLNGRQYQEHPVMQSFVRTRDGRARKLSDFLTRDELHRTALYQEYYRHVGVEYQMAIFLGAPSPQSVGFALSRDLRDFSERDRLAFNLLRPHLATAYDRSSAAGRMHAQMALLARAADVADAGIALVGSHGRIDYVTRRARHWLREYFPRRGRPSSRLPALIADWLTRQAAWGTVDDDLSAPPEPLVVARKAAGSPSGSSATPPSVRCSSKNGGNVGSPPPSHGSASRRARARSSRSSRAARATTPSRARSARSREPSRSTSSGSTGSWASTIARPPRPAPTTSPPRPFASPSSAEPTAAPRRVYA